ncbi:MAG: YaiI/YqxD family protein [Sulfuricurvum sp.]|nr:YaiI/YqxD family protein [Sulfuricurvum sp.]
MKILVDADAFPNALKEVLLRAVLKRQIPTLFIANKNISIPNVPYVSMHVVPQGPDEADHRIAQLCEPQDLVITADIPLADRIVTIGAIALDPRGTIYDENNIKQLLAMRNLMEELRNSGEITGGPAAIGAKTVREFADGLNKLLSRKICFS